MKRSPLNFFLVLMTVSILGTFIVAIAQEVFGVAEVFIFSVCTVVFCGISLAVWQIIKYLWGR